VVVVTKVDHRSVGCGEMGPIASKLRTMFDDIVRGKNPKYAHWNTAA